MVSSVSCLSVCGPVQSETFPLSSLLPHILSGQRENMADATFTSRSRRGGGSKAFHCSSSNPCHTRWQYFPTLTSCPNTLNSWYQSWSALIFEGLKVVQKCVSYGFIITHLTTSVMFNLNLRGTTKTHFKAKSSTTLFVAFWSEAFSFTVS